MASYYQVQRGTATADNGRYFTANGKTVAVIPFCMPKHGGINSWEFSGTKTENSKEVGVMPKGFNAYLFSCAQAFMDYMKTEFGKVFNSSILKYTFRGEEVNYSAPENYTGNPGDYIIIGGASHRDSESYPIPNCVKVGVTEGDRPYYNEDGERFWQLDDKVFYFAVIVFDTDPSLTKLVSTIYYN